VKKIYTLLLLCSVSLLVSCGESSGGGEGSGGEGGGEGNDGKTSATLSWDAPTENEDLSKINTGDIVNYRIYYGLNSTDMAEFIEIAANDTSYTINYADNDLPNDTVIFIAMTATNSNGFESNLSELINFNTE
jgi:hypothetical protein